MLLKQSKYMKKIDFIKSKIELEIGTARSILTQTGDDIAAKSIGKSNANESGNGTSERPEVAISISHRNKLIDKLESNNKNDSDVSWQDGSPKYMAVQKPDGSMIVYKTNRTGGGRDYEIGVLKSGGSLRNIWQTTNRNNSIEKDVKNLFK